MVGVSEHTNDFLCTDNQQSSLNVLSPEPEAHKFSTLVLALQTSGEGSITDDDDDWPSFCSRTLSLSSISTWIIAPSEEKSLLKCCNTKYTVKQTKIISKVLL